MFDASSLNERQLKAASYGPGNLLVLAGPGSGKTYTSLQRIFFLIEKLKVPPDKILVITFTKDAALSMQKRFIAMESFPQPVCFGTFHSVFFHILQSFFPHKKLNILSADNKKRVLKEILSKYNIARNEADSVLLMFIQIMSFYKNTGDLSLARKAFGNFDEKLFSAVFKSYEEYRAKNLYVDYDDMVMDCLKVLSDNPSFRNKWQDRFEYILIDEFQDINPVQYETVRLLKGKQTELFAVGDDDQSIYGFRGASPACLRKFISDYNSETVNLNVNYRNSEEIITAARMVIEENCDRIPKESVSDKVGGSPVNVLGFPTQTEEYEFISKQIMSVKETSTACLFRTNLGMQNFAVYLNRKGIHFRIKEKVESIYEHFAVRDILAYFKLAYDSKDAGSAMMIANKPARGIDRELIVSGGNIYSVLNIPPGDFDFIKNSSLYLGLNYIVNKIGYRRYLNEKFYDNPEKLNECRQIIEWLKDDMRGFDSLSEYYLHMKSYEKELKEKTADDNNCVLLMTMHGSKGLEFENVFIPDCNEGNIPHGKMPDADTVSEERRLFYVAMTRSFDKLYLMYVTGTKERIMMPSRFLNKLIDV